MYPIQNEWLFNKILQNNGCIITEYAPNIEADQRNFPKRNRIVSGLSDLVLVVEAEFRSGTSITAGYAKKQKIPVCCIPSNINSRCGIGTNKLIQEGAKLVTKPNEIIELLNNLKEQKEQSIKIQSEKLPKEYSEIYQIIKEHEIHINDLCKKSKKTIQELTPILTILEIEDYITSLPGNQFKIKEEENVYKA